MNTDVNVLAGEALFLKLTLSLGDGTISASRTEFAAHYIVVLVKMGPKGPVLRNKFFEYGDFIKSQVKSYAKQVASCN